MTITKRITYSTEGFDFTLEPIEDSIKIKKTKKGYDIRYLTPDNDPDSPRNWDNLGKMICFHNRYSLGDKHDYTDNEDFVLSLAVELNLISSKDNLGNYTAQELVEEIERKAVILPLYLYDHSGISMRTYRHGQHASWDCGQVGYIYITKEQLKNEKLTKKRAEKVLIGEVETYNQYLTGDTYTIVKETYDKNKEQINYDCIGGFYGYEDSLKALETEI